LTGRISREENRNKLAAKTPRRQGAKKTNKDLSKNRTVRNDKPRAGFPARILIRFSWRSWRLGGYFKACFSGLSRA
jgi:hypothetical protein